MTERLEDVSLRCRLRRQSEPVAIRKLSAVKTVAGGVCNRGYLCENQSVLDAGTPSDTPFQTACGSHTDRLARPKCPRNPHRPSETLEHVLARHSRRRLGVRPSIPSAEAVRQQSGDGHMTSGKLVSDGVSGSK